jgi:hypothetical protein
MALEIAQIGCDRPKTRERTRFLEKSLQKTAELAENRLLLQRIARQDA